MPTTPKDSAVAALNISLQRRVGPLLAKAAITVQAESGSVTNHTLRSSLANKVLNDIDGYAQKFTYALCGNYQYRLTNNTDDGVIKDNSDATVSDATLSTNILAIWDAFSLGA